MGRMNGKTWWRASLAAGAFAVWAAAGADEIVLGVGETHVFSNAEDAVQMEAVRLSDRAVLEKRGAGTLTFQTGAFTEHAPVDIHVREGAVAFAPTEPPAAAYVEPKEIMNRAAFWVDAGTNVQLRAGTENEVAAWLDVRETGAGSAASPYLYTRAVAFTNEWLTAFPLAQSYLDRPGVYCRGYGSGCFLNWVKPDGAQANIEGLRHVFVVHGGPKSRGHILGQRTTAKEPYFQREGRIWADHNGENKPIFASRTYLNGREIDPFSSSYPAQSLHVVEVEALGASLGAMCFYNDRDMQLTTTAGTTLPEVDGEAVNVILGMSDRNRGGDRAGGEYVCEVLLFTNDLTAAERIAVSDWLNQKWRGTLPPASCPATAVALAPDAVFVADHAAASSVALRGDGIVRKTGAETVTLRSAYEPRNTARRVQVDAGLLNLGYALPLVCAAGDTLVAERRPWGPELAPPEAGEDKTRLVKRGTGPVTLDAVPEGVTQLRVEGGELRLADPERARSLVPSASETVAAAFPDADFEMYPATDHTAAYSYIPHGQEAHGWHAVVPGLIGDSTANSAVFFFDQRLGSPKDWNMVLQTPPTGVLAVKNNASAWCEIDIPSDGDYTLSFRAAPRGGYAGDQLDVMIGPDAENLVSFGAFCITTWNAPWRTFAFPKLRLAAGRYQFWLRSKENNLDRCTQFDDFRLVREPDAGEWALPNGGFEQHADDFANAFTLANAARVPGFTVRQCLRENNGTAKEGTSSNTTFSVRGTDEHAHFNLPWNRAGSETQFYMSGIGSQLETTFTPPAGTWRFRADFCSWATTWGYSGYVVAADLRIGGTAVTLGVVTNQSYALLPHIWPGVFTVDGATPVTLTLTGDLRTAGQRFGHGILDNLALVAEPGENLLREGGFESLAPWQVTVTPKPEKVNGSIQQPYDDSYETFFGLEAFEGKACMKIVNDDTVAQTVTFPTGGLYRLSANFESRSTPGSLSFGNGLNPVAFFCARGGVTNWLGVTDTVAMTNFHEYACLVRIPEAGGVYDVGFQGRSVWGGEGTPPVDRTTLVDGAQLYRVETARPLDLPEALEIDVAAGAQLTLDFDGTNTVRSLRLAGRSLVGYVSLADRPELLGALNGRGTLFIRPRGTVLILR